MYICICKGVTDREIVQEVEAGARSIDDVKVKINLVKILCFLAKKHVYCIEMRRLVHRFECIYYVSHQTNGHFRDEYKLKVF